MKEIIREIRINDVENFNKLLDSVINQSEYLLFNPENIKYLYKTKLYF